MAKAKSAPRLVALVGTDVLDKRFEAGDTITADLTERQRHFLLAEGYAQEVPAGQRLPSEVKEAIEKGAATEHEVTGQMDTKEV